MRKLALLTLPLLVAGHANAIEYLNIDNGPETWAVGATVGFADSEISFRDKVDNTEENEDETSNSQFLSAEYRNELFQLAVATSQTTDERNNQSDTDKSFHFKAGTIFAHEDGTALALNVLGEIEQDKDNSDSVGLRISAGRHIDELGFEVNVDHMEYTDSEDFKGYSSNSLELSLKYQQNQYLTWLAYGYGGVATDIKYKDIAAEVEATTYNFGIGIGSDPISNLDVIFMLSAGNIHNRYDNTLNNEEIASRDDDYIASQLSIAYLF